jgi:hypothetical protein
VPRQANPSSIARATSESARSPQASSRGMQPVRSITLRTLGPLVQRSTAGPAERVWPAVAPSPRAASQNVVQPRAAESSLASALPLPARRAAALAPLVDSSRPRHAVLLQRAARRTSQVEAPQQGGSLEPEPRRTTPNADAKEFDDVVQRVFAQVVRKLAIEAERRGSWPWPWRS